MKTKTVWIHRIAVVVMLMSSGVVFAGGWAVVTIDEMPNYFVAGRAEPVTVTVRAHGRTPVADLSVALLARSAGLTDVKTVAHPTGTNGQYRAMLTLPAAGEWTVQVDTNWGFMGAGSGLPPVKAIRQGDTPPAPLSDVAQGERLFMNKGCITCHVNREVNTQNVVTDGPDLTGRKFPAEYLQKFLADPASFTAKGPEGWGMPNLNLKKTEIAALVAFINRDRSSQVHTRRE